MAKQRFFPVPMLLGILNLAFLSYQILAGHARTDENQWRNLISAMPLVASLPQDQASSLLMTQDNLRRTLIDFGPWSHERIAPNVEQFTFNQVNNDQCRGLMWLWGEQGSNFPVAVQLNGQTISTPSEEACPAASMTVPGNTLPLVLTTKRANHPAP